MVTITIVLAAIAAAGVVVLETWGRRQTSSALISREDLRYALNLLRARGVDGTSLVIEPAKSRFLIVVEKRVRQGARIGYVIKTERSEGVQRRPEEAASRGGDVRPAIVPEAASKNDSDGTAEDVWSTDEIVAQLDSMVGALGATLFPGSYARFRGAVLAFNRFEETGSLE